MLQDKSQTQETVDFSTGRDTTSDLVPSNKIMSYISRRNTCMSVESLVYKRESSNSSKVRTIEDTGLFTRAVNTRPLNIFK